VKDQHGNERLLGGVMEESRKMATVDLQSNTPRCIRNMGAWKKYRAVALYCTKVGGGGEHTL